MSLIRPSSRIHDPQPFLEHTKKALEYLVEITGPAIRYPFSANAEPLDDTKRYAWRFPDVVQTKEDVTQVFALVLILWRELEEAIEVFTEEYGEHADTLRTAACHLDTYANDQVFSSVRHLQLAITLINEVLDEGLDRA